MDKELAERFDRIEAKQDALGERVAKIEVQLTWRVKLLMALTGLVGAIAAALLGGCATPAYAAEYQPAAVSARAPIRVSVPPNLSVVTDAMEYWNEAIGCRVFVKARPGGGADLRAKLQPKSFFYVGFYRIREREIWLYENALDSETQAFFTAIHELGHVLGLRHVDDESSVMYPSAVIKHEGTFDQYANRPSVREFLPKLRANFCE